MIINIVDALNRSQCTGCGACVDICPNDAIQMRSDNKGFLYPSVCNSNCSECSLCFEKCPVINKKEQVKEAADPIVYAAWSLDSEVRYKSTSGGIFSELAKCILSQNGYVAGAKYNGLNLVEHTIINNEGDIEILRQSKYIQSEAKNIFEKVKNVLDQGKKVLFVGTPCQCAAMKSYMANNCNHLYLCDFICRGVNSPYVYMKYLEELETQYGSRVKRVWFKNKAYGWNDFCTKIIFENGQEYLGHRDSDPFMYGYIKKGLNLYIRPSCGQCNFKGINRPVDITLGDFWGVKLHGCNDNTDNGVSLVIVHTVKGEELVNQILDNIYVEQHSISEVSVFNACLTEPVVIPENPDVFYDELRISGFTNTIRRHKNKKER